MLAWHPIDIGVKRGGIGVGGARVHNSTMPVPKRAAPLGLHRKSPPNERRRSWVVSLAFCAVCIGSP